jgi:hypothetical protein
MDDLGTLDWSMAIFPEDFTGDLANGRFFDVLNRFL